MNLTTCAPAGTDSTSIIPHAMMKGVLGHRPRSAAFGVAPPVPPPFNVAFA